MVEAHQQVLAAALGAEQRAAVELRGRSALGSASARGARPHGVAGERVVEPPRQRAGSSRPRPSGHAQATSRRGWRLNPAAIRAASMPDPITVSPSSRSIASFSIWPSRAAAGQVAERRRQLLTLQGGEPQDALAAALDVEERLAVAQARRRRRRSWRAPLPSSFGQGRWRRTGLPGRWRPAPSSSPSERGMLRSRSTAPGSANWAPPEALDEVAAPRGAQQLQVLELAVDRGEPAGDALGDRGLAGDDPVALQHQLGLRPQARPGRGRVLEQGRGQRPAAEHGPGRGGPAAPEAPARALAALGGPQAGARSGAKASLVTSPDQARSQRASCSSSAEPSSSSRSSQKHGPWPAARGSRRGARPPAARSSRWREAGRRGGRPRGSRARPCRRCARAPRADPDQLAAGAELIQPGRAVAAEAARQDVAFPGLRGQRDP